jgi:hypothetical protein
VNPIAAIEQAPTLEAGLDIANRVEPDMRLAAHAAVARSAQSEEVQLKLRHELEEHIQMLEGTPRAVIRFLNAYAIQRLSNQATSPDVLARWTVLDMRWPAISQRLIANPDLLDRWHTKAPDPDDVDLAVLRSPSFHNVVLKDDKATPALVADDIRRCLGIEVESKAGASTTIDLTTEEVDQATVKSSSN